MPCLAERQQHLGSVRGTNRYGMVYRHAVVAMGYLGQMELRAIFKVLDYSRSFPCWIVPFYVSSGSTVVDDGILRISCAPRRESVFLGLRFHLGVMLVTFRVSVSSSE